METPPLLTLPETLATLPSLIKEIETRSNDRVESLAIDLLAGLILIQTAGSLFECYFLGKIQKDSK